MSRRNRSWLGLASLLLSFGSSLTWAADTVYSDGSVTVRKAADFNCARPVVEFEGTRQPVRHRSEAFDTAAKATVAALASECELTYVFVQLRFNGRNAGSSRIDAVEMLKGQRCSAYPDINPPHAQNVSGGPLTHLGYPKSVALGKAEGVDLFWGFASDRSTSYLVMVHNDPLDQKVAGLTEQPDRSHQFAPAFVQAINERLTCFKYSIGTVYARHYVAGYDTEQTLEAQRQSHVRAPLFSTNWRFDHNSKRYKPTINGFFGTFSAVDHCLEHKVADRRDTSEVAATCPGFTAPQNLLAERGYLESDFIADVPNGRIYSARLPGSRRHPGAKNQQVFVIEHVVGHDDPVVPFVAEAGGDIDAAWLRSLEALEPIQQLIGQVAPNNRLDIAIHHHVKGFSHPERESSYGTEQPIAVTSLAIWGQHRDVRQRVWTRPPQLAPVNTVNEALARHEMVQAYQTAYQAHQPLFDQQRIEMRRQARIAAAERYGTVIRDRAFWEGITGSTDVSELEKYHDGLLHRSVDGDSLSRHYLFFMERFGNQCKHKLNALHGTSTITTTRTTRNANTNQVTSSETEERQLYYDYEYGEALEHHFNRIWNDDSGGQPASSALGMVFDYLRNPNRAARDMASLADILSRPARHLGELFDALGCDDPSLEQIRINLLRASQNKPSLQDTRQDSFGNRRNTPTQARLVATEMSGSAHVRYSYADTPAGWLPANPSALLAQTRSRFGDYGSHHIMGWIPTMVELEVMAPAAGSLAALSITRFGFADAPPVFWMRQRIKDDELGFPTLDPQQLMVICEYRGADPVMFWFPRRLPGVSETELRALHPSHPMLAIGDPQSSCPAQVDP